MENQNNQINIEKPKNRFWRFAMIFCATIIGILILYVVGAWGWQKYRYWRDMGKLRAYEEGIKKWQQEDYETAMADIYGGKTPQETLRMYIDAVEKGDYELASKYFIGDYQERELKSFKNSKSENIKNMLDILQKLEIVDLRKNLAEMYEEENKKNSLSESKEDYINRLYDVWDYDKKAWMETKIDGYDFSVSFKKYPNGIWKIIEI